MKILMTGATGLVGSALTETLKTRGDTVGRLLRRKSGDIAEPIKQCDIEWTAGSGEISGWEGIEAVVNLAGAPIAGARWTKERKALLLASRLDTTRELVKAMENMGPRPRVLVSASGTGYYGNRGEEVLTEESVAGEDFLSELARGWEAEALKAEALGIRVVVVRFGIILAQHGGALPQMMMPFRFGMGGKLGSGQQWMSWITLADAVGIIRLALENETVSGVVNVVSPAPVRNAEFTQELARVMGRPGLVSAPAFALRLAMGEMADALLLSSQRVVPQRLEQIEYRFLHADLAGALEHSLSEK